MAKVAIKSEKLSPFGGIFHVREHFSRFRFGGPVIDKVLGLRCTSFGYQSARLYVRSFPCSAVAATAWKTSTYTAMAANFYRYIVALPLMAVLFGIKATDRVKSFLFRFIAVPAKWIRTARQYKLNIYSNKPYNIIWEHG